MTPQQFVDELQSIKFENVFNPYSEQCNICDRMDAAEIRSKSMQNLLSAAQRKGVDMLWIGRDLGYRGGRRTGFAFTDNFHLQEHGARWNLVFEQPTVDENLREMTATFIWRMLRKLNHRIFLWNVFPFHPHCEGDPFSNRLHNKPEKTAGLEILAELIDLLQPKKLIPIGNDAAQATKKIDQYGIAYPVRHPSYGGYPKFRQQMLEIFQSLEQSTTKNL